MEPNKQAASIVSSSIQPLHMLSLLGSELYPALEKLLKDCAAYMLQEKKFIWNYPSSELMLNGGDFDYLQADVFLAPQIEVAAKRFNVDMSKFPTLHAVYESCNALPEFRASVPDRQPDAVQ
ncbi:UNVERIFIED_CONTAM: hypothetical protein Slati_3771900 [Sesamum latifolium]|uniref:GST C-terminal domain-containing protein n=1 Tax=Sesamum latifolium TaxID=2727402 RepID=A0AAW2U4J4_9LAMI